MLSLSGRTCHFTTPSKLLSGPVRCCQHRVGQVILLRHPGFLSELLQRLIENTLKKALLIIPLSGSQLSPI